MKRLLILMALLPFLGLPVRAQDEETGKTREVVNEEEARESAGAATAEDEKEKILRAIELPQAAEQAREEGVPPEQVKDVLDAARRRKLPAGETEAIMTEETKAVRDKGQIDNFGSFVKSKLDEGLRGRELSEAIRAEHAAHGKGKGHGKMDKHRPGRAGDTEVDVSDRHGKPGEKGNKGKKQDVRRDEMSRDEGSAEDESDAAEDALREKKGKGKPEKSKGKQDRKQER